MNHIVAQIREQAHYPGVSISMPSNSKTLLSKGGSLAMLPATVGPEECPETLLNPDISLQIVDCQRKTPKTGSLALLTSLGIGISGYPRTAEQQSDGQTIVPVPRTVTI